MKLSASLHFKGYTQAELIRAAAEAGFAGYGFVWKHTTPPEEWALAVKTLHETGLAADYVHAPFGKINRMWRQGDSWQTPYERSLQCLHDTARAEVPVMVMHCYIGFENRDPISQMGIDRFGMLVREAEKLCVKIAFENTEGEAYLAALMGAFCHEKHVGFCFDSGHEACYNGGKDLLALYGSRLLCTHLNDNMGSHGVSTPQNDLHLLPFDGILNWEGVASRLDNVGYHGTMNFELLAYSKPGRHENDKYAAMGACAYARLAYERACRVAALRKG